MKLRCFFPAFFFWLLLFLNVWEMNGRIVRIAPLLCGGLSVKFSPLLKSKLFTDLVGKQDMKHNTALEIENNCLCQRAAVDIRVGN